MLESALIIPPLMHDIEKDFKVFYSKCLLNIKLEFVL
jgi:hypothetical protein